MEEKTYTAEVLATMSTTEIENALSQEAADRDAAYLVSLQEESVKRNLIRILQDKRRELVAKIDADIADAKRAIEDAIAQRRQIRCAYSVRICPLQTEARHRKVVRLQIEQNNQSNMED